MCNGYTNDDLLSGGDGAPGSPEHCGVPETSTIPSQYVVSVVLSSWPSFKCCTNFGIPI
jgi:hypothetical protein